MKKKEAMKFIRKQKGYIPYVALFELYNDDDEIPQELIDVECKKDEPKGNFMIVGQGLYEQLKNGLRYGLVKADHYLPIEKQNLIQPLLIIPLVIHSAV